MDPHGVDAAANDESGGNLSDSSTEEDKAIREVRALLDRALRAEERRRDGQRVFREEETEEEAETEEDEEEGTEAEEDEHEAEEDKEEDEDGGRKKGEKEYDDEGGLIICRLSDERRVTLSQFKGETLVSITEHYKRDGKEVPKAEGISLTADEWDSFKKNVPGIEKAIKKMESIPGCGNQFPDGESQFQGGGNQWNTGGSQFPGGSFQFQGGTNQFPSGYPQFPGGCYTLFPGGGYTPYQGGYPPYQSYYPFFQGGNQTFQGGYAGAGRPVNPPPHYGDNVYWPNMGGIAD
ncbi:RNA polymerase II transcriptional coactivator KELP-like [Salvia divinorum]|uniref:RNA polymerase II transcriptional coactivator KELP-like n=1 Tax=Salvia divinorum TaxID=28513 RepID=A0ABD1FK35_SALDI